MKEQLISVFVKTFGKGRVCMHIAHGTLQSCHAREGLKFHGMRAAERMAAATSQGCSPTSKIFEGRETAFNGFSTSLIFGNGWKSRKIDH
jgi:hypothetical protein